MCSSLNVVVSARTFPFNITCNCRPHKQRNGNKNVSAAPSVDDGVGNHTGGYTTDPFSNAIAYACSPWAGRASCAMCPTIAPNAYNLLRFRLTGCLMPWYMTRERETGTHCAILDLAVDFETWLLVYGLTIRIRLTPVFGLLFWAEALQWRSSSQASFTIHKVNISPPTPFKLPLYMAVDHVSHRVVHRFLPLIILSKKKWRVYTGNVRGQFGKD